MGTITDKELRAMPGTRDIWLTDSIASKGSGRFTARITTAGKRLFYFRYTDPSGKRALISIGEYDATGKTGVKLKDARQRAGELSRLYMGGATDLKGYLDTEQKLSDATKRAKQDQLDAEHAARENEIQQQAARISVEKLFDRWESSVLVKRKDGGQEIRRMFKKDVLPTIGHLAAADVHRGHITELTDALVKRGVNRMGSLIFASIRQMFRFAVTRGIIEADPTAVISKRELFGKATERERVLSEAEVKVLAKALPTALNDSGQCAVWIMLATCCRIGEITRARWEHVDLEAGTWVIPAENSKSGRPHTVALSPFALEQFETLRAKAKADAEKAEREVSPWVLPARNTKGCVCSKSLAKQVADRQRGDKEPMSRRSPLTNALTLSGGKWVPHDLRRTGATLMVELGVQPEVIERCLNHTEQNRMKRIYQRHNYAAEMANAWRLLGDRLDVLTRANADNVVTAKFGQVAA